MQTSVALSSMESEYMAESEAAQDALRLNRLLQQLGLRTPTSTVLYENNKASILFPDHPGDHRQSKHIDTRRHFVRETVVNGEIALVYIPTAEQQADGLTKALPLQTHYIYRRSISLKGCTFRMLFRTMFNLQLECYN